jgi:hypothetical protein
MPTICAAPAAVPGPHASNARCRNRFASMGETPSPGHADNLV